MLRSGVPGAALDLDAHSRAISDVAAAFAGYAAHRVVTIFEVALRGGAMSDRHILIVFATSHGQTAKIASRMADVLTDAGNHVTLWNADEIPRERTPGEIDGIIIGAPVLFGRHRRSVRRFVQRNLGTLRSLPSAFFSVSGSAASRDPAVRAEAQRIVDAFLRESGWTPAETALIGGAMAYTKYNPLFRWLVRRVSAQSGGPTDTSRDHEFTDWAQVEQFALRFAEHLTASAPVAVV